MKKILNGILLVILCTSLLIVANETQNVKSSSGIGTYWLTGWTYRVSHIIDSAIGAGVNYTMPITVINGTGTDSGDTIFAFNKTKSDFSDVRFTNSDGSTLLYYWNETVNIGANATFWFKDIDNLSTTSSTIYVYYENPNVSWDTTYCSMANTFVFGDDFQDSSVPPTGWTRSLVGTQQFSEEQSNSWYQLYNFTSTLLAYSGVCLSQAIPPITGGFWIRARMSTNATLGELGEGELRLMLYNDATENFHIGFEDAWIQTTGCITSAINGTDGSSPQGSKDGANPPIILEVSKDQNNRSNTYYNGAIQQSATGLTKGFDNITLRLTAGEVVPNQAAEVDYIWVRNYVNPEPAQGAWGTEEVPSVTVYGYADKPFYRPGETGTLKLWVYNIGAANLVLENVTIFYPWYNTQGFWSGNVTIVPSASTLISPGGNWSSTSSFTVPNDGRISSGTNSISINVVTDKITQSSSISMSLANEPYYSSLQNMDQILTWLMILAGLILFCALIIIVILLFTRRPQKMPKP